MITKLFIILAFSIQLFLCIRWDVFGIVGRSIMEMGTAPDSVIIVALFIALIKFIFASIPLVVIMWFVQGIEEIKGNIK
jgi:hypothetical protein